MKSNYLSSAQDWKNIINHFNFFSLSPYNVSRLIDYTKYDYWDIEILNTVGINYLFKKKKKEFIVLYSCDIY